MPTHTVTADGKAFECGGEGVEGSRVEGAEAPAEQLGKRVPVYEFVAVVRPLTAAPQGGRRR
jgi:hypothetical protein